MGTVLVVDDERSMREFLAICLRRAGHEASISESGEQAVDLLDQETFDVVVTDLRMPGEVDGLALLKHVRARDLDTEVIVVTAFATPETAISAMREGAYDYLTKPFKVDEINAVITRAMEKRGLARANRALREQITGRYRLASLIGRSSQMQRMFEMIGKIHSTRTTILLTGESGVGKEVVARALHSEGNRGDKPFIAINCGAIPEELMESELFGHIKGAFTGAVADKPGLFKEADTGILFLDEIGELSLSLQVKLLRVLQEKAFKPVGATAERKMDVRVIAATNRELEEEVARGAFRSDLYYRLNVIELRIPPLRERRVDIPLLVDHAKERFCLEQEKRVHKVTPQAMSRLEGYDYPGNVRELENIIERAVTLCSNEVIEVEDLPTLKQTKAVEKGPAEDVEIPEGFSLDGVLRDYERSLIERAMKQSGGVRKKAAHLLGISFRSFRYRLSKLGLESDD